MAYQDILVVIDQAATAAHRLAPATALARRCTARLDALYSTGSPMAPAYADVSGWLQVIETYMAARRSDSAAAEATFRQALADHQLTGEWLYREAEPTRAAIEAARLYDLVVLAQPDPDAAVIGVRPEEVVLEAGRPVLLIPYAGEFGKIGRRVLVAWSGTREATRALHDAMGIIADAEAVTVVAVDAVESAPGEIVTRAEDVAAALVRRGIKAEHETLTSEGVGVPDLLLSRAADLGADMIVMGGYGHSRFREYVLGGVSRSLFQQMTVPVLMAH